VTPYVPQCDVGRQASLKPVDFTPAEAGMMRTTTDGIDLRFFYRYLDPDGGYLRIQGSSIGVSSAGQVSLRRPHPATDPQPGRGRSGQLGGEVIDHPGKTWGRGPS